MQKQHLTVLLAAAGTLLALNPYVLAQQRVALVIGNAVYEHAQRLANPLNDAADLSAALTRLGFSVTRLDNADKLTLEQGLHKLSQAAAGSEIALVFYAGHGIEVDKRNFLVPVGAHLASEQDVEFETVSLDLVMRAVGRASGLGLVILDACRENPFVASMRRSTGTRSIGRGLARVEPAGQTLVAYAAKEGQVAADGGDRNSPYTAALLAHVETPGLEIMQLFREVRDTVLESTADQQEPFLYGSLSRKKVYLTAQPAADPRPSVVIPPGGDRQVSDRLTAEELAAERVFWESVKDSEDAADVQAYLDRYPAGTYEVLARNRLRRLGGSETTGEPMQEVPVVSLPSKPDLESVETGLGLERPERRLIQLGLASEGFDPGPADGLFGQGTRGAIARWQASRGEEATGYLEVEAVKVLLAAGREHEQAVARRLREQEARESAQLEEQEKARRESEERARREAVEAERRREREPGRRFRDCDACPEMVVVPAGSYMMGSPSGEEGRLDSEGPRHRVTIAEPFAVGVHEVTRGEFARFAAATNRSRDDSCWTDEEGKWAGRNGRHWRSPGFEQTDRHPVVCVSWDDARAYARWLSRETGERYRLLSESEWEYVARGGTRTARYWGESESGQCRHANAADFTAKRYGLDMTQYVPDWTIVSCDDGYYHTAPAGTFARNNFGLHDVLGNAWEWVQDCWHDGYGGAPSDSRAWESGGDCDGRVPRGGSWLNSPRNLRSAFRFRFPSGTRSNYIGFRVARTLTP